MNPAPTQQDISAWIRNTVSHYFNHYSTKLDALVGQNREELAYKKIEEELNGVTRADIKTLLGGGYVNPRKCRAICEHLMDGVPDAQHDLEKILRLMLQLCESKALATKTEQLETAETFGKALECAKNISGATLEQLGKAASKTPRTIINWQKDEGVPSVQELAAICKTMGLPPDVQELLKTKRRLSFKEEVAILADTKSSFSDALKAEHIISGLPVRDLANAAGVSGLVVRGWRDGVTVPSPQELTMMCDKMILPQDIQKLLQKKRRLSFKEEVAILAEPTSSFSDVLKAHIAISGLSYLYLGKAVGVSHHTVRNWCKNEGMPSAPKLEVMCEKMGLEKDDKTRLFEAYAKAILDKIIECNIPTKMALAIAKMENSQSQLNGLEAVKRDAALRAALPKEILYTLRRVMERAKSGQQQV